MDRKDYLENKISYLSEDMDSITSKIRHLIQHDYSFTFKDFEKAKKLMKKLVSLSNLYEKLYPEYILLSNAEREQILNLREEQAKIKRQKDDKEFEKMCNTPCPNPPINLTKKDFLEFIQKNNLI